MKKNLIFITYNDVFDMFIEKKEKTTAVFEKTLNSGKSTRFWKIDKKKNNEKIKHLDRFICEDGYILENIDSSCSGDHDLFSIC